MNPTVRAAVDGFFRDTLNVDPPADGEDILASGRLDSLGIVELVLFLEQRFGVRLSLETLEFDDIRTVDAIERLIDNRRGDARTPGQGG